MKNNEWLYGFLLGGIIGGSTFYLLQASEKERKAYLKKMGKMVSEMGSLLEEVTIEDEEEALGLMLKKVPPKSHLANVLALATIGIKIWKKRR